MRHLPEFLARDAKALGFWSAAIGVVGLLFANTTGEWAKSAEQNVDKVHAERADLHQSRETSLWRHNVEKQLSRIENRLPFDDVTMTPKQKSLADELSALAFLSIYHEDAQSLVDDILRATRITSKISGEFDLGLQGLIERAYAHRDKLQVQMKKANGLVGKGISPANITDDEAAELSQKFSAINEEATREAHSYLPIDHEFSTLFAQVESRAERKAARQRWITSVVGYSSLLIGLVGSLIGLTGKYLEAHESRSTKRGGEPVTESSAQAPSAAALPGGEASSNAA